MLNLQATDSMDDDLFEYFFNDKGQIMNNNRNINIINHILEYCKDIQNISIQYESSMELFQSNPLYKHASSMCIFQIGEMAEHLTSDFKMKHSSISWNDISKMKKIAIHHDTGIAIQKLFNTLKYDVPALKLFCEKFLLEAKETTEPEPAPSSKLRS
jgi:uncharacterized protein with HEPN domain